MMQWLVTGCSSGLGLELARAILKSGQKCIASSRNPSKTPEAVAEIEELGGVWITLDVAGPHIEASIADCIKVHGPIDVLVNNAGYADGGVLEAFNLDNAHAQMETNFFGPIRTIKAVLPTMREQKAGVIINVSSAEFWEPHPVASVYAASKFAIEGLSEALSGELSAFGIRVLIAEPGGMRTDFFDPKNVKAAELPKAYEGTMADFVMQALLASHGKQGLDPRKTAEAIVTEVLQPSTNPPLLRLPLGKESLGWMKSRAQKLSETANAFEEVALAADFES